MQIFGGPTRLEKLRASQSSSSGCVGLSPRNAKVFRSRPPGRHQSCQRHMRLTYTRAVNGCVLLANHCANSSLAAAVSPANGLSARWLHDCGSRARWAGPSCGAATDVNRHAGQHFVFSHAHGVGMSGEKLSSTRASSARRLYSASDCSSNAKPTLAGTVKKPLLS